MTEPPSAQMPPSPAAAPDPAANPPMGPWERLKHHKVLQWTLAYVAAAYTLLHATQMVAESFEWPHLIVRLVALVLALGVPIVVLFGWYHGHKAQHRFSTAELSMLTVLLVIAGSILWAMSRHAVTTTAGAPAEPSVPRTAIAVMPFANLTGDPSKDYLGDGMAEQVIDILTKVPGLKVPARTSSFAYKGRNADIRQIAKDLGVGAVLEGSVRSAGQRIRVTAQLIDAQDGLHIWSDTYDKNFTDIFALQDELATAIVNEVRGTVDTATPIASAHPTQDIQAYDLLLQAQAVSVSPQGLQAAMSLLDQAIARDPRLARAFAVRASLRAASLTLQAPLPHALVDAERDAERAIALDPDLAQAHWALAEVKGRRGDWVAGAAEFQKALAADPADARIRTTYAVGLLAAVGQMRSALAQTETAYRLAPADVFTVMMNSSAQSFSGNDGAAVHLAELAAALGASPTGPPFPDIYANAARRSGRYDEAARILTNQARVRFPGPDSAEVNRLIYEALADRAKAANAAAALRDLVRKLKPTELDAVSRVHIVSDFAMLGALDDAFQFLNASLDEQEHSESSDPAVLARILWTPDTRPLRRDPRFQAVAARLRFMDYWKQYGPPDDCDLTGEVLVCR